MTKAAKTTKETNNEKKTNKYIDYTVKVLNGMAQGLFASLLIGLIVKQIGIFTGLKILQDFGTLAQFMMGPAIGVGVAHSVGASPLALFSCIAVGALGGGTVKFVDGAYVLGVGEAVGAFVAALIAAEVSKLVAGKTKVDIVLVPMVTLIVGGIIGKYISPHMVVIMTFFGEIINTATNMQPIPMGIIVSVIMGIVLTLPISSAALAISLGLSGLAGGASLVGCCCNMVGFAVISYKENGVGGLIAQGIGTSMLQIPNIVKKPIIWLPVIISSAILGPISTAVFKMEATPSGAGMGTSGLVGQFSTIDAMGANPRTFILIAVMHFILPAIISYIAAYIMRKKGLIQHGDMKL